MGNGSLVDRAIGAARLDIATYEEIEHDEDATLQALAVVVVAATAAGIGVAIGGGSTGLASGILQTLMSWVITSGLAYIVGVKLIPGRDTEATVYQLLRTIGFAHAPLVLVLFAAVPIVGWGIALAAAFWSFAAQIVAIRQALEVSTLRALAVIGLSILLLAFVGAIVILALGGPA